MAGKDTNMHIKDILTLLAGAAAAFAVADDDYSGYVQLTDKDTAANQSWNAKGHWSDKAAPSSTKSYYVPAGALLWQQSGNSSTEAARTWNGGRLVIGGTFLTTVNNAAAYAPLVRDLVLLGGSECRVGCFAFLGTINGITSAVTVEGTTDNPAVISHHHANSYNGTRAYNINGTFTGAADSAVVLTRPYVNYNNEAMDFGWSCDIGVEPFASYPGTLVMRGGNFKARPYPNASSYNMPLATLRVEDGANCHFYRNSGTAASDAQIGALDSAGGRLYFNCRTTGGVLSVNPVVNVSKRLSLDAGTVVTIPTNTTPFLVGMTPGNAQGATLKIAHLTGTAAETVGDISAAKVDVAGNAGLGYPVKLVAMAGGDGSKDVFLATPNVAIMTNSNSSADGATGAFDAGNGWMWTNLETPAPDSTHTFLTAKAVTFHGDANYPNAIFSGASSVYSVDGARYVFKEINLCQGCLVRAWGTSVKYRTYKAEKLNVLASSATIDVSASVDLTIDADVCGEGNLQIGNYNNAYGSVHLTHANTNFHGRLTIRQIPSSDTGALTPHKFITELSDSRNWGGECNDPSAAYRAITLKDFPFVRVPSNVTFDEGGRGMLVQGGARFNVAGGKTLTFGNQITYAGVFEKNGNGTLNLGGTARFIDGDEATAPVSGTNELHVIAGALKISSKTAADGLAITFDEGTRLIIPADTEAGYYNKKWADPISIGAADGKLQVEIEPVGIDEPRTVTVPICTFGETAADRISREAFSVSMNKQGMRLRALTKRPNGDGTVSYLATFGPVGFRLMIL